MFDCLGFVAGRLSTWRVTAPLLAVVTYVVLGVGTYSDSDPAYLSPARELFSSFVPPAWWAPLSAAVFLAVGLAAVLLLAATRRWLAVPVLALAVLAALPIARTGRDAFTVDAAGQQLVCADGDPQVCLTRRHADQLPEVAPAVQGVLAGVGLPVPINEQRFGEGLRDPNGVLNTLYLGADLSGDADLSVIRQDAAQRAVPWDCDGERYPPVDDLSIATFELTDWVRDRPAPPYRGVLEGRTSAQALGLVRQFAAAASACDLPAARALLAALP